MKKSAIYAVCGVVFLAGAVFGGVKVFQSTYAPKAVQSELMEPVETSTPSPAPTATPTPTPEPEATPEPTPEPTPTPYVSPVDFEALWAINPDICAWLVIDDTNISFPVVQSQTDDTFYLNHNSDGDYSANGAIFSEHEYNSNDFSDPVTILYGHHQWDGAMFGKLQQYFSDESFWAQDHTLKVYTPDGFLEYGVFAAVPYSGQHILYYHNFSDENVFSGFFADVMSTRDLSAHTNDEYAPEPGDKVLILSTCLISNNTNRFLVMGTLLPDDR